MVKGVRRTTANLEQLKTIGRELAMGSQGWGTSKDFMDVVKAIGEAKSKAEEERIVTAEIEILKKRIAEPDVPRKKMKEYIIRLVYVEMLGHDASFGYIHAVKMTHDDNLLLKKTGYLAVTLFLNEDHDLIILIVNTIQKDLCSDNHLVACAALTAVCKLINEETIPAILPHVVGLLNHPKEIVKKKAVMALHRFHQRAPYTVSHLLPKIQKAVDDTDPSVISAALCALFDLITADPRPYKSMTPKFCSILKHVAERRLAKPYDYRKTPAPFIQIKVLKILALLGAGDKPTSEIMYNVLSDILRKTDDETNIGNAILYECMCTITAIHPHPKLVGEVATITSRFLKHAKYNLKYMGIDSLGRIIKINPDFAEEHQLAVLDCLEDPDDTLKRKTLDLLYKMTRSTNVEVIVDCMITYMRTLNDAHNKTEIASRIIELAERFAPSNQWFIHTMNQVFELAGDLVPVKVAHDLMRLIAEGAGEEDEDADSQLRSSAVESYLQVLGEPKLPSILLQVICWVLGEYGIADGNHSALDIIGKLCDVIEAHPGDDTVKGYGITAITKICAFEISAGRRIQLVSGYQAVIDELSASHSTDLQQRAYELQALLGLPADVVGSIMPLDASCEDIEVDRNLSFLTEIVETALANGARPYVPEDERDAGGIGSLVADVNDIGPSSSSLKFEAYEKPAVRAPASTDLVPVELISSILEADNADFRALKPSSSQSLAVVPDTDSLNPEGTRLRLEGVQRKWGRQTYSPSTSYEKDKTSNGPATVSDRGSSHSRDGTAPASSSDRRKEEVVVSAEKQKLAASLFGGTQTSRSEKKAGSGAKQAKTAQKGHTIGAGDTSLSAAGGERVRVDDIDASKEGSGLSSQNSLPPPPDLLDFSDEVSGVAAPTKDPFQMLAGLADPPSTSGLNPGVAPNVDLSILHENEHTRSVGGGATSSNVGPSPSPSQTPDGLPGPLIGLAGGSPGHSVPPVARKGLGVDGSLQKDVKARQAGVIPTTANPNMFKDLLG